MSLVPLGLDCVAVAHGCSFWPRAVLGRAGGGRERPLTERPCVENEVLGRSPGCLMPDPRLWEKLVDEFRLEWVDAETLRLEESDGGRICGNQGFLG